MASCECCWSGRWTYQLAGADDEDPTGYNRSRKAHEERGCACSKNTLEGLRLRAGQWWKNGKDSRYTDEEWFALLDKLPDPGVSP